MSTYKERYEERKKKRESGESGTSYRDRYMQRKIESGEFDPVTAGKDISSRIDTWFKNNENFITNYNSRFQNRTGTLDDYYVTDSGDFLNAVTAQKSNFEKEASSIISWLDTYGDYVGGREYVDSVKSALNAALGQQSEILKYASGDRDFWSQFADQSEYYTVREGYLKEKRAEGYKNKYAGKSYEDILDALGTLDDGEEREWLSANKYGLLSTAEDFADKSRAGYSSYEADIQLAADREKAARRDEKWYEKLGRYLGDVGPDTTLPNAGVIQATNDIRKDTSYMKPSSSWSQEQKDIFGYLYATDKGAAAEYAQYANEMNNKAENEEKTYAIEEWATRNGFTGALATLGSIAMMPFSLVDTYSAMIEQSERGFISTSAAPLPGQVSGAIRSAISETLNQKSGTLNEKIPVIGGKGLGDVYQLGTSIADSMLTGYTQGTLGTYMVFFGSASASGIYEAKERGATDEQAVTYGILSGLAEAAGETFSIEHLLGGEVGSAGLKGFFKNVLSQAGIEASEEGFTTLLNNVADQLVMGDKSNFNVLVNYYMTEQKLSEEEAKKKAWGDMAGDLIFDMLGGAVSGGVSSGIQGGIQTWIHSAQNTAQGKEYKETFGSEIGSALANEAVEISPDSKFAQRMQSKAEGGRELSDRQVGKLIQHNEAAMRENDVQTIKTGAANRLTELGEKGNVDLIATALTKQVTGESLSLSEKNAIKGSKYAQRVANEMSADNIRGGGYSSAWAEKLGTDRINADEYSRMVAQIENEGATVSKMEQVQREADSMQVTGKLPASKADFETDTNVGDKVAQEPTVASEGLAEAREEKGAAYETPEVKDAQTGKVEASEQFVDANKLVETTEGDHIADADKMVSETEEESGVTLEAAAAKYGAQAGAMVHTFVEGQDVAKYDAAYRVAYDMGKSGVSLSYAMQSESTAYLTESQRELAYEAGAAASKGAAEAQDAKNKAAINGKTGRRKGTVRGEGVTISDLKASFNDTQGTAYKLLSTFAEATGVDIVLYKSEANADGRFEGAQGRFKWSEDTIYIDINAGLADIKSVNDLAKYTMMRTFAHEFTHFIEKWNPIWYNELRRVVFDTITERGENADSLIAVKMEQTGLDYEAASREVVAEAMTDILPDANFVEELATKHRNVFEALLAKLKEFLADLRAYFSSIGPNSAREANALKEQVGDSVKYVESVVKLFDRVAAQAVENYQMTVTTEEVAEKTEKIESTDTINADNNSATEKVEEKTAPKTKTPATKRTKKSDWAAHDVEWHIPGKKTPIAYSTRAASDLIEALSEDNPSATIKELLSKVTYDEEAKKVLGQYIDAGYGDQVANEWFNHNKQEVTTNVEETGTVLPHRSDGERASRLLAELQTEDVPGDGAERNPVDDAGERGGEARRDDNRADAAGSRGGSGEGDRESGDLRRDDVVTEESSVTDEKLHEEVAEVIAQRSTEQPRGRNFVIGDSLDLPSGEKARYKANVEAIRLVKQLEAEGRYATEAEQIILSKYVGWGGLANAFDQRKTEWAKEYTELKELLTDEEYASARGSTLNAHYTDISVIKAMYDGLAALGFEGGRLLEPSSGVGNFVGAMPAEMSAKVKSFTMVELDGITGLIAKYLYPNADVRIQGFEKANIPDNYMDVAISNVPFGNYAITDKAYPKKVTSAIHNYFFAKSLDKVRPGGIVMFITSSYTMNSKDSAVRRYIMQRADLLGAIRLPDSAFKGNAGTEVVTDIIVLKKRAANTEYAGEDFLEAPYKYIDGYNGAYINSYFDAHPEMVLGTATMGGGMYRSGSLTYKALEGKGSLGDQIREAFKSIKGKMEYPATQSREKTNFAVERASKGTKENGLVVKDGKVYQNRGGELIEQTVAKGAAERITGMLEIRDAARELMTYQQQGLNEGEIKKARVKLNRAYDAFVKKYGFINSQTNKNAIKDDPDKFSIFALENYDPDKKTATKADIFSKNTIAPNRTVTSAKDVAEGLIVSVNQTGGVDAALIARLTGKTEADVTRELIDTRRAFKNRNGALEAAETYLSGNVRAKLREAEALAPIDADYKHNVEALKSVIPADVGYQDIFVNAGTPWIPNSVYSDFAAYMLGGRNTEWRQDVDVTRNPETGNFTVELKSRYLKTNAANTQKWGTSRRSFLDLFDAMLNSKSVVVKDRLEDGTTVINRDATAAANEKIENIQKEFTDWLWRDEARRTELATLYNEVFNSIVTPKYNGDNLTVNGANALKPLRPHQRDAVQRVISSGGNTLLAHKVGAGKTYEMAAAAMKLRELGLVRKPMFAVPKSLVAQWGNEFKDFFPTAKLLVAEASDFTAANRKVFMNRIANGEYDAVIVSYEQFEKLPMSDDFTRELYQEQIDSVMAAIEEAKAEKGDKALSIKDLEKKRKSLQAKIDKLTDKAKDEDNIDFEQLGVDSLFVDEAHNFKNLFYTTSMTNVSGLGNKDGSKRAFDLYTKVRYLQQLNGGRGIVFATATPVMNSMSEMYIMQKYLQPDLINQLGLSTFDAWAKQFGEVVNGVEIKPSGQGYRVKQSFSRFKNMSELQLLFRNFADVLTDIPGLKIPKMKGGRVNVVVCEPGQFQQDYMKELEKRADNIKNVDPSEDNMLKITSDGRKISYTQRMIDPSLPYEEGCKIYRCADNVIAAYNESRDIKGTQLIFCDMATPKGKSNNETATEDLETDEGSAQLYDDLKARLRALGIPAKEIAFIHEADTDAKKKKLFADVNEGKVRVLIGSTGKMGVGMNAQKRVVAIHHLDAPWRPGDVEQRNGRAFRQGNINDEVECFTYVTEGSFDARLWDILERKQNFINQIMNGESVGREAEDTGEVTLSAAEVKALASGSPLILEQVQLDTDIKKLESLYRAHLSAVRSAKARLMRDEGEIATLEKYIEAGRADLSARVDTYTEGKFSMKVGKTTFTDKKDAGAALMAAAIANAVTEGYTTIGSFAGFDIRVIKTSEGIKGLLSGKQGYGFNTYPERPTYMITHLSAVAESIEEKIKLWEHRLAETQADIAEQEKLIAEPFGKQAELDAKRARYNEVMAILNPKEEQALDSVAEDIVQEQSRSYLTEEYPTYGVHWGLETGIISRADARIVWEAIANIDKKGYNSYQRTINGEYFVEGDDVLMVVDADYRNPVVKTIFKFKDNESYAKEVLISARGIEREVREAKSLIETVYGKGYVEQYDFEARGTYERKNGRGKGNHSGADPEGKVQHQQRTDTLTDREVLQAAAEKLASDKLDEGERAALEIFNKRLYTLETLQEERAEQGRLYKEQQFGAKVDRAAAAETLERMHILDGKIKAANASILEVENKEVLGRVLKKARRVVEAEQKAHDDEIFKRYVDRAKNAAAIKKYRERIKADVDDLTSWVLSPNNKDITKHVPDVIKNSVIPFLKSIDFTSKQQLRGGDATKADAELVKRLSGLEAALKENIETEGLYSGYADLPPYFMERLNDFIRLVRELTEKKSGEYVINKMTSEELKELAGVVKVLKAYVTQMNKFHANAMFAHVWEAGDSTIDALSEMGNNGGEANAASNFVFWQQIRPAYAFERFGEGGRAIYDGLRRGQAQLAFNTQKIVDFTEKAYTDREVKAWEREIKNIKISAGTVKMRVSDIMSFYELAKQPDSLRHMLGEGMRVATYSADGKKISDNGHALTEADIATITGTLTERQREVADAMQKFMQEQGGAWGNYVSVARFGEELFTNEQYFPINSDGRHLQATADEHPSNASLYALLNMSFTKSRNEKANNRIVVYSIFDVFANHMASMAQYNAMALPVLDAIKWFNYQQKTEDADGNRYVKDGVREQMDRVYGVPEETRPGRGRGGYAQSFVLNIIKAFNGTEAQGVPTDSFGMNALRRYNMAQIAFNFRVVVQQPLAITRAALLIDYGSIMKGMKLSPAAIKKNIAEMREHSGIAAWKALGFYDVNISRGLTDTIKHSSTLMQNIGEVGMKGAEWADTVTWAAMWSACKEEVIKKQKLRPGDAGFFEAVTKLFEDVVYKTQVVDSILTKNEFMRSKGFFARAIGSFMSEPTTTASMLIDAVDKYNADLKRGMNKSQAWERNKRMIGRTIYVYAVSATLLAAVQAIADAWRDDDDYETFLEKWLEAFGGNIVDELMPLNKLPILSDFYDVAKEVLSIFGVDTYGNPPQTVFMQWYDSLIKGTEIIYDKIAGKDTNYTWYGGIYKLLQAASGMIGAPMAATTREVVAIWNNIVGAMAPSLKVVPDWFKKVKTYDAGETNELKYAYADGYLTFEEAINELIEQGLVDNEDEAYFTVSGWEAGEGYSRYDAIYDAVLNGGDFDAAMDELTSHGYDERDVMRQIKSQIGTWYSDDKSDIRVTKQQAIGMLEKYTDMTDEEIEKTMNRWSSKVVTGIAYEDIGDEFLEGNISASRATEMYMRYGGLTKEAAGEKVAVLKFVKDYPQFEAGDVSYSMVEGYLTYGESAGIDVNVFYDVWKYNSGVKADVDKKGNTISGSKKEKVLDYIDSLDLTKKQKDSLYYALGWAESNLRDAPWR